MGDDTGCLGEEDLTPDNIVALWVEEELESAMNAQERELDQLLPDSLNRPMSERIQGLKERADREANLAVELRDALKRLYGICRYASPHDDSMLPQWDSRIAEAERLLAERGEKI